MYCQLGNIRFENLNTFTEFAKQGSAVYAEHGVIDGKPRLQRTGLSLSEISLSMRLHVAFCVPSDALQLLTDARDNGEILPLVWGNGDVEGDYVITDLSSNIEQQDPAGNVFSLTVSATLKEFVVRDRLQQEQATARQNAKAVGDKKPVAKKKANSETCAQAVTKIITGIEQHAAGINKVVLEQGGGVTTEGRQKIRAHNTAIISLCNQLIAGTHSCAASIPGIATNAAGVKSNAGVFNIDLTATPARIPNDNAETQRRVKNLKIAARPLINQSITRK